MRLLSRGLHRALKGLWWLLLRETSSLADCDWWLETTFFLEVDTTTESLAPPDMLLYAHVDLGPVVVPEQAARTEVFASAFIPKMPTTLIYNRAADYQLRDMRPNAPDSILGLVPASPSLPGR
jgi:hypothetical protein